MSGKYLCKAWDAPLPSRQKLVLITLGDLANADGQFSIDPDRLSNQCGMSPRKINRCIIRLVNKEFIKLHEGSDYVWLSGTFL